MTLFEEKLISEVNKIGIDLDEAKAKKCYMYMTFLIEYNKKVNLTAIRNPIDMLYKHFLDCMTVLKYIKEDSDLKIIDIGTGGGFPGVIISIMKPELKVTLLDSVKKKTDFLIKLVEYINLKNVEVVHKRVEDLAHCELDRESFDYTVSRAVAPLNILLEYHIPLLKINGKMIVMKSKMDEEKEKARNALRILYAKEIRNDEFNIIMDGEEQKRTIAVYEKEKKTPNRYPRKAGIPKKTPL